MKQNSNKTIFDLKINLASKQTNRQAKIGINWT